MNSMSLNHSNSWCSKWFKKITIYVATCNNPNGSPNRKYLQQMLIYLQSVRPSLVFYTNSKKINDKLNSSQHQTQTIWAKNVREPLGYRKTTHCGFTATILSTYCSLHGFFNRRSEAGYEEGTNARSLTFPTFPSHLSGCLFQDY